MSFRIVYQGIGVETDAIADVIALLGALAPRTPQEGTVSVRWPLPVAPSTASATPAPLAVPKLRKGQRANERECKTCEEAFLGYGNAKYCPSCKEEREKPKGPKAHAFDDDTPLGAVSTMKPLTGSAR